MSRYASFPEFNQSESTPRKEEAIQQYWADEDIFKKTLDKKSPQGEFVFYEGPPTANGKPGIHHLESRAFKDAIPRYKTMQGYHVRRKAGWDTHGLPVELQMEKKLGLTSKKEIEAYGIAEFNTACKESVLEHIDLWDTFTKRIAYWVDQHDAYYTFDPSYMESLWWVFAEIYNKDLVYKDYKVVPWCPRCGTALSSHELGQPEAYVDVKDLSVTAKFELVDEPGTYVLAWTTTPWTLPGNVALAVGDDIDYVKVATGDSIVILAKERLEAYVKDLGETYEVVETFKGSALVGKSYVPLFDYFGTLARAKGVEGLDQAYKIYPADFVTTEDGTGVVHTAVMYGQEDFELGTAVGLPKMHVVDDTGHFIDGVGEFSGLFVKDEATDVTVIKALAGKGLLFAKQKYEHAYPHCWRCKTPLVYYARDSWYIRVSDIRDELVASNQTINWEPAHIKDGRFGEWLAGAKDWAISRERYWGTPLPIWESEDGERILVDSIETLLSSAQPSRNTYYAMRHGEADSNVQHIMTSERDCGNNLTDLGKEQVQKSIKEYVFKQPVDVIITSPLERTVQSAELVAKLLGLDSSLIIADERLRELSFGDFENSLSDDFFAFRYAEGRKFEDKNPQGESYQDAKRRFTEALKEYEQKYQGKTILLVTHGVGLEVLDAIKIGANKKTSLEILKNRKAQKAEIAHIELKQIPLNNEGEIDLHRPYIDDVILEQDGKEFRRVPEVMDVWFDSGAMPFAQDHYPFEHKEWVDGPGYPADYISEAIDQTRGWFYTLHAVGNLLGRGKAYKNVICLGHLLDAQGKKMSKSLGNVVDPWEAMEQWGADALRYWMYSVTGPGDSKNFDPKTVTEVERKVFNLFRNVATFYEMYVDRDWHASADPMDAPTSTHPLDRWMMNLLSQTVIEVTSALDVYDITRATRILRDTIGELSQWYVRRSRDRFKEDADCRQTLRTTLHTLSRLIAPFAPYVAEEIFQITRGASCPQSIHLTSWPRSGEQGIIEPQQDILDTMEQVRLLVSKGLELRDKAGIKVRQPLAQLTIPADHWIEALDLQEIILDELNIKILTKGDDLLLDTTITEELQREGNVREVVRIIQAVRKESQLSPQEQVAIRVYLPKEIIKHISSQQEQIELLTNTTIISFEEGDGTAVISHE